LYRNKIQSVFWISTRQVVLTVNFKDVVKAIKIASNVIEENKLEVKLWNEKYWQEHALKFYNDYNNELNV